MKTFVYKGFTEAGRSSRGLVEALDLKEAREKLARQGIFAETVSPATGAETDGRPWRRRRASFTLDARAMIYRELGSLVRAGLPLVHALDLLVRSPELGDNRTTLAAVRDRVRDGEGLAAALAGAGPRVTPFEQAVVAVGERAGTLHEVLERVATFLEQQQAMRERIATAMLYPAMVVTLALGIGVAVLGLMVPRVGAILTDAGTPLPWLTLMMLGAGRFIQTAALPVLAAVLLGWILLRNTVLRDAAWRKRIDRRRFQLPIAGRLYTALVNLRFARTLAMLLEGGVPLVEGLTMAGQATGSPWVGALVTQEAESVRQGQSLAASLRSVPPLQASLPGWVEAGEASGDLCGMLECAADRYQSQWDRLVNRFLALLEPALVIAIGVFVLLVAMSILMPLLAMNQQL